MVFYLTKKNVLLSELSDILLAIVKKRGKECGEYRFTYIHRHISNKFFSLVSTSFIKIMCLRLVHLNIC